MHVARIVLVSMIVGPIGCLDFELDDGGYSGDCVDDDWDGYCDSSGSGGWGTSACYDPDYRSRGGYLDWSTPVLSDPPAACRPSAETMERIWALQSATEGSYHELVTCGGMQMSIARSFLLIIIASNASLFKHPEEYTKLANSAELFGLTVDVGATQREDGAWVVPMPTLGSGSTFAVSFHSPDGAPIRESPFAMSSYLEGVTVESSITIDEMYANTAAKNTLTFAWETEGPLAHLLAEGGPIANPFTVTFSLQDVLAIVWYGSFEGDPHSCEPGPDWGPLRSVLDAAMTSSLDVTDYTGVATIRYQFAGADGTLAGMVGGGDIAYALDTLSASDGIQTISSNAGSLRYLSDGGLAGTLDFEAHGPSAHLRVTNDFGEGRISPHVVWSCL